MASNINPAYIAACQPLDRNQSMSAFLEIQNAHKNLQFFQSFLEMCFKHSECIETYSLQGMIELIQNQLNSLYVASLILCPEIDREDAADVQNKIEAQNRRMSLRS